MPVAVAVGAAGIGGAAITASAAKSAGKTQAAAANRATDTQLQIYGQTRDDLSGYRDLGSTASSAYARLLGINDNQPGGYGASSSGGGRAGQPDWMAYLNANPDAMANFQQLQASGRTDSLATDPIAFAQHHYTADGSRRAIPTFAEAPPSGPATGAPAIDSRQAALEATPGYQFARTQGIQAAERSIGTRGLTGALAKGIGRFVTGLADQTYGENVNRLRDATTIGANAAAGGGQIGAQTGANVSNTITGAGAAQAAGTVGSANAIASGLNAIPSALLTNRILNPATPKSTAGGSGIYGQYNDSVFKYGS